MRKITVIGAGYVGLVTGSCLAELGHCVTCLEINPERLSSLRHGELPIYEPGLAELVATHTSNGRLRFSDDYEAVIPSSDFVFVAVNTPQKEDGSANTEYVFAAVRALLEYARPGLRLVVK